MVAKIKFWSLQGPGYKVNVNHQGFVISDDIEIYVTVFFINN